MGDNARTTTPGGDLDGRSRTPQPDPRRRRSEAEGAGGERKHLARPHRRRRGSGQLELARDLRPDRLVADGRSLPVAEPRALRRHLSRDGGRRGRAVLRVAAPARARACLAGTAGGHGDRRNHALAIRGRVAVQDAIPERRRRAPDRPRWTARVALARRRLRADRARRPAERRRRRRRLARLHQPGSARLQP